MYYSNEPKAISTEPLEWCLASLMLTVGIFMLIFQPGWRAPLEQLILPGLHLHLLGLAWPLMLLVASFFQVFTLYRNNKWLRRSAAGSSAFVCLVMTLAFAQANYFVVGVPVFLIVSAWQGFICAVLRDVK